MASEDLRLSHMGLVARSPEGHAAKGMAIRGQEDLWVEIQAATFRNWVNEHLRPRGEAVRDLSRDLSDGTRLIFLVEELQKRRLKCIARPANQHQSLENVATALEAIANDGVKLVNIGSVDIVNGNLKLILGLIWSLIVRYQIGRSKFPPKKLMMAWLKAALPDCRVSNFTTDWNSGKCLSALLDYCRPGINPHWRELNSQDSVGNCRRAMETARREFNIPVVLEPEYLASPYLDELSGMTYLSYFMREGGAGYQATLRWVQSQLPHMNVTNFTTDWNDGLVLCNLVRHFGGPIPGFQQLQKDQQYWESNLNQGISGAQKLGVEPLLKAKDMADPNVEHLGVMAYAANFQWVRPRRPPAKRINVTCDQEEIRVGKPVHFRLEFLSTDVMIKEVTSEVRGPGGKIESRLHLSGNGGKGTFLPHDVGIHELLVLNEGEVVQGCPIYLRVLPEISKISFTGLEPAAIGSIVEVLVNSNGTGDGSLEVSALSPSGHSLPCPVRQDPDTGAYTATFQPDESGEWAVHVLCDGEPIQGSPFPCFVYDPNGVELLDLEGAEPGRPFSFMVDARASGGLGHVAIDIAHHGRSFPLRMESAGTRGLHRVYFTPQEAGKYRIFVYFNGHEVKDSPFVLRVGQGRSKEKRSGGSSSWPKTSRNSSASLERERQRNTISDIRGRSQKSPPSIKINNHRDKSLSPLIQRSQRREEDLRSAMSSVTMEESRQNQHDVRVGSNRLLTADYLDRRYSPSPVASPVPPSFDRRYSPSPSPSPSPGPRPVSPTPIKHHQQQLSQERQFSSSERTSSSFLRSSAEESRQNIRMETSPSVKVPITGSSSLQRDTWESVERNGFATKKSLDDLAQRGIDTSSNVRVMTSTTPKRDSWQSLEKSSNSIRKSVDHLDGGSVKGVDTSSNVRVSAMSGGSVQRRDSWDVLSKTRSVFSRGSLESIANIASGDAAASSTSAEMRSEKRSAAHNLTAASWDHVDAVHPRLHSPLLGKKPSPDPETFWVRGEGIRVAAVRQSNTFTVSAPEGSPLHQDEVTVSITDSSDRTVPARVSPGADSSLRVIYSPTQVGEHLIDLHVGRQRLAGAPYRVSVYDASAIRVGRIPDGVVGHPVEFHIDGSEAGSGDLEILVNGGRVTSQVRSLGGQRFLASFVPHDSLPHAVEMRFNGEQVPGSPWQVEVMAGDSVGSHSPSPAPSPNPPGLMGDSVRHVGVGRTVSFDVSAPGFTRDAVDVHLLSPSKRPSSYRLLEEGGGVFRIEFTASEVGSYVADVTVGGRRLAGGPLLAKAYNSGLIRVTDVGSGVVGQPCQFRVDASQAGEGQLEISVNDGELPNHVQVLGGGRCLVSFTPEQPKAHTIDIKFNGETVSGCPFVVKVADTSHISVTLRSLELIPVDRTAKFHIAVDGTANAELAVSVRGPTNDLPVKVSGNVRSGFTAEFTPREVGPHTLLIEYNGLPVPGTPFLAKAYDARRVEVSPVPRGSIGRSLQFTVDASQAGEGNLEITITARGRNVPTQVHPQGSARFTVSFVPLEAVDHMIAVAFNKEPVPGSPLMAMVQSDPHRIGVSGQGLSAAAAGKSAYFSVNNVSGSVEDLEVNVEGPGGMAVPAQVTEQGQEEPANEEGSEKVSSFKVEFTPRAAGEHRVHVAFGGQPVAGSPFSCKVYDVGAIRVKEAPRGVLGMPVTFLVETSQAGPGNLEVTVNGGQVPTSAQAQGPHTYAISFTPKESGAHVVELRFNGESVPGSPFTCQVADASRVAVSGEGLEKVAVGKSAKITIQAQSPSQQLGEPEVHVTGPSRHLLPVSISTQGEGRFYAEYIPTEVGDHTVELKLGDQTVPGSPFVVKAYDATKVKVTDVTNGTVGKPLYFSIDAGQAGAGNLEIIVSVGGRNVPNYVQAEGNARFRVNFKPSEAAPHTLSVRFNGEPVPGSPFTCKVRDSSQVVVAGPGLKMAALGRSSLVTVDPRGLEVSECTVSILSPSGQSLPVSVSGSAHSKFHAEFVPVEVGPHNVSVLLDNEPVGGSPFICNVYDVNKVKVTGLGASKIGKPVTFTVDASQAGEGTLELVVTSGKASVRAEVTARSRGLYDVTFVPHEPSAHFVNITFNDEDVPGSPFRCQVSAPDSKEARQLQRKASRNVSAMGDGLQKVQVGSPAFFHVDPKGMSDIDVRVQGPHGLEIPCRLGQLGNGLYRAEYTADRVGAYLVTVFQAGQAIGKQPYSVSAFDPQKVVAAALAEAVAGKEATIRVSTASAGSGVLTVSVRAVGKPVKHSVRAVGGDSNEIRFTPRMPVPHRVDIRFNGVPIPGSPMEVPVRDPASGQAVTASGTGLHQARIGRSAAFVISTLGAAAQDFDVVISGPKGEVVPVRCYQQRDGNLLAEFQPTTAGICKIEVTLDGKAIRGSPFYCQVFDPTRVKIVEVKDTFVVVGENIVFKVSREEAGFAELEVVVTSPLGRNLPIEVKGVGDHQEADLIEFSPSVPGRYKFAITYGGDEVSGSPITFLVEEEGTPKVSGPGLTHAQVGSLTSFRLDTRGISGQPEVQVDGPDSVAICEVKEVEPESGVYLASYTPQEVGVFDVRVFWNGREIAGSPFHPRVVDPVRIRVIGGWDSIMDTHGRIPLAVGKEKRISFEVGEAGPGQMKADLQSPSGIIQCPLEQIPPSRIRLGMTPTSPGDHQLHILWSEVPLPNSPIAVTVPADDSPDLNRGDAGQVVLTGRGLASARCGEEAEFTIDGGKAGPGSPEVSITSPKAEMSVPVQVQPVGGGIYKAIYSTAVVGTYLLNVTWAGRQVKGCPLKINVASGADASKVVCTGDGLRVGTVGRDIRSFIDTRRAGPGELTAQCAGPRRGAYCELYDHGDGTFTLNVRPQEAGKHTLTVKYGGDHVPGSPFPLRVLGAPDASKVRVYGPGIEHGVLAIFQSRFICDTRGAGAGQLTVRIRGPKGAFRVEMQRESQKDRTILCKFDPTEPGDYRVEVKWAGEHVPGSPFLVMIFDTQEELNRFLQGNYSPQPGATGSSEFYGSNGYSTGVGHMSFGQMSWRGSQAQL